MLLVRFSPVTPMTDEQKDELPNLWVRPDENWDKSKHPSVRYSDRKYFDDDVLYIPADRISSFIADLRSTGISLQQRAILDDLESLLSEGEAR